jgi:hypothetical protein
LQTFVTASLIQLLCRVTKFGWFDDDRFREVVKESMNFLSQVTYSAYIKDSVHLCVCAHTCVCVLTVVLHFFYGCMYAFVMSKICLQCHL